HPMAEGAQHRGHLQRGQRWVGFGTRLLLTVERQKVGMSDQDGKHRGSASGAQRRLSEEAMGFYERQRPVLGIVLWDPLAAAKSGSNLQEGEGSELIDDTPSGLLIVSYMRTGVIKLVGERQGVALTHLPGQFADHGQQGVSAIGVARLPYDVGLAEPGDGSGSQPGEQPPPIAIAGNF